jgi:hypothetical protein
MVFGSKKEIVDDASKSKVVTRTQTEGSGVYSCTAGDCADNPFTTTDKKAYEEHRAETTRGHFRLGAAPCPICHKEVDMNVVVTRDGKEPIHPECRGEPEEL